MEQAKDDVFEFWAIVELFGHQKIAGRLTEKPKGSVIFFQIDVPDGHGQIKYSRIINASSIYAINPTDKETVLKICGQTPFDTNRPAIPYIPEKREPMVQAGGLRWQDPDHDSELDDHGY